ncbi:Asp23/Gls24 family envelope stress response protein [Corynebacterium sanguinis]|uniref:Asp23/Gls24 family envelope stress response protein n=1 Tax=Corynebacterium sanguinis TaxID=2594913 RepID=UPI0011865E0B|nr:Asp23/Gls24 family envelope stress response protein [Corynebacterium sanguinis]MCT1425250.1 Asp23/Gls24 family envelope stress response protein [Corynebacterium sanguinis]MCT1464249.1 Asp23/Gls24 family envelope stress response protein [Corynebacterium sanguinis]MCT2330304.1 Asp23/Gls24 family envelope stress response protein [Corynebacterium sanguinis]MDN8577853.1 Asp23/Gls24 family envelope stress response protein [Corynebacterium sanguinis]QDR77042.1 Asp23/Gls24 family envelope stress re
MAELTYQLSERTVEHIAEAAARKVPGSIALDAKLAGLAGRSLPRSTAYLNRRAGTVTIDADIAASYPAPIAAVTDVVREAIRRQVSTLTGLEVTRVNIKVANAKPAGGRERVDATRLDSHPIDIAPTPVRVRSSSTNVARVSAPPQRPVRSVQAPEPGPDLAPIGYIPAEVIETFSVPKPTVIVPQLPTPTPLRPITLQPVVNAHARLS